MKDKKYWNAVRKAMRETMIGSFELWMYNRFKKKSREKKEKCLSVDIAESH